MNRETYKTMIGALLPTQSEKGVFAESDEQARDDQPESQPESEAQPDSTENPRTTTEERPRSAEGAQDRESDDQPTSTSQTQTTSESQSRSQFEVSPYIGYNSAAGYEIDLDRAVAMEYDPEDDDGSDIASGRGGFVVGIGANFALLEQESFDLKLRPSIEIAFVSGQSESTEEYTLNTDQQYVQLSGDATAQFDRGSQYTPYAGVGLALTRFSASGQVGGREEEEIEVTGTSIGLNLLGGIRLNDAVDFGIPYAQLRLTLVDPRTDTLTDLGAPSLVPAITLSGGVSLGL